jgi:hypothetical protein
VKIWVKARAASPARPANPREKVVITTLRSELFIETSFSSNPGGCDVKRLGGGYARTSVIGCYLYDVTFFG